MAAARRPFVAAVLLLVSSGLLSSSPLPACPEPCTCQRAPLLNCSSSGLSLVPQRIQDSVTELDLSHNLLVSVTLDRQHRHLRNVWLGNNSITRLSLCMTRDSAGRHVRGRRIDGLKPWSRQGCVSWAPTLQLLSAERNLLEELPEGLEASESLQVLQLSFNRISTLQPGDLSHLWQLKELHLQHNLITSLHPQMFQDLAQLRVLDLSFNMLTSLHPLTYPSLRNIGADVRLDGNRWQCDCSMRSLRRRMAYDSSRGRQSWSVVCASPSTLSGRDVLQLEEDDLNCFGSENRPELHQDVTVYSGSEILLSCSAQDSVWWTPSGQASASQPQDDLLITDITESDTGLYVCVSEEHEVGSVFNLQISKIEGKRRKPRSLPQGTPNRIGQERNQRAAQCNLTLAVCLSVFITFLIAFIIGVLVRPYIDILCRKVTKKKRSTETISVSDVEQRQYDNEAYSNSEEPEVPSSRRERRVTFSDVDIRENTNVQYYDTVASGDQESLNDDAVFEHEAAKAERDRHTAEDSGSESSLRQSSPEENQRDRSDITNAGRKHNIEFEHIPDSVELEKRTSSSSSSDSSLSGKEDRITQRDLTRPKSPQLAKVSVQQRADFLPAKKVEMPQISIEGSENLEFSSEPFADWSPHTKNPNLTDPDLWQENDEQFEFSDSVRSISPRSSSVHGSFNDSKLIVASTPNKQKRDDTSSSSSSSYVSEGEPTEYTVTSDQVNEKNIESNHNKPEVTIMPSLGFNQGDYRYDPQRPTGRPKGSFSSHSSDSDGEDHTVKKEKDTIEEDTKKKVVPMPRTKFREPSLGVINHGKKTRAPPPPAAPSSSSSSESEAEIKDLKVEQNTGRVNEGIKISEPKIQSTKLDPQIKRSLDIKARVPSSDSSSSSDSEAETTGHRKTQEQGQTNTAKLPIKVSETNVRAPGKKNRAPPPPAAPSSSSSSESEAEIKDLKVKQNTGRVNEGIKISEPKIQSTKLDPQIKRSLDIKARVPSSDSSSSSDSEAETTGHRKTQEQGQTNMARLPIKVSQPASHDPQTQWPVLDLDHKTSIERRLDIKVPSLASESSSSSNSEDEKTGHVKKQEQGQANMAKLPIKVSETNVRAPRPDSETSSSSDSEAEKTGQIQKQMVVRVDSGGHPFQVSQTVNPDLQTRWPVLDLGNTAHNKRRLDIKAPSPDSESSSSSSDSENEKTGHIKKQEQGQASMVKLPIKASQHSIKEPKPDSDSSSSSDSEAETTGQIKKQEQRQTNIDSLPIKVSPTASHDPKTQWPVLDLEHTTRIKRRLDIRVPSPASESSSSSNSVDEKTGHIKKQEQGQASMVKLPIKVSQTNVKAPRPDSESSSSSDSEAEKTGQKKKQMLGKVDRGGLPFQVSQTANLDLQTRWPVLDLEYTTHIKRRLDIKAPSPDSESSSSSSDSEDEKTGHIKKQEQGQTNMVKLPIKASQRSIKEPKPDSESSSSSDSEAETTGQIKKQEQRQTNIDSLPIKVSPTASHDPKTQWPVLDLEHTTRIKRRLDIRVPSPASESSSSSNSVDEKTGHIKKQEQGQASMVKLPIKVSQTNVKAPRPDSESSSSSDSEAEKTGQKKKQMLGKVDRGGLPFQVSQTANLDLQTRWPVLDLEYTTHIKRRLDIKAPSPDSESSSSSSDSEDEKTGHIKKQEQGQTNMVKLPIKASQRSIKEPKPDSESSSSSDSEAETTGQIKKQEQRQTNIDSLPIKVSPTTSHDPKTQWPVLDLGHTTRIKRRLDIKAPSPASESSSSSDSEDEITGHLKKQEQGQANMVKLPIKVSQTNVKAPRPDSDSSSSSDSEDETTGQKKKQMLGKVDSGGHPLQVSQPVGPDLQTQWPVLDLGHTTRIKRHLDIKAPSPASESSSSSDSEDEIAGQLKRQEQGQTNVGRLPITAWQPKIKAQKPGSQSSSSSDSETETTGHIKKQEQGQINMASLPIKVSPSNDPQTQWPLLDLEHTTGIKRRLDIKAPSPASESSSSSDSEAEKTGHMKKQEQKQTNMAGLPIKISQTNVKAPTPVSESSSSSDSEAEKTGHTKKQEQGQTNMARLPIKASQTNVKAPRPDSESSSSSDSEAETTGQIKKQEQGQTNTASLFTKVSHTASNEQQTRWPLLDLERMTSIKRRLDIKAPSPASESSSSSDSEAEKTGHMKKQEQKQTNMAGLPIKISQTNVKAPTPDSESSSSSDSEDETTGQKKKQMLGKVDSGGHPLQVSQPVGPDLQTQWPVLDLGHTTRIKRHLDIKAPSPASESSSSSDSEDEIAGQLKRQEQGQTNVGRLPITAWQPKIKAQKPGSQSSSSSDSETETTGHIKKQEQGQINMASLPIKVSPSNDPQTQWPLLDLEHTTGIKRRLDIKAPSPASESSSSSDSEAEKTGHMKKQEQKQTNMAGLPIKISQTNVKAPTPVSESSSSSDSEAEKTGHTKKQEQGQTNMARLPIKASQTNVKAPRPDSESSSSSDSEAETTGQIKKQEQGQTNTASLFTKVSHTASNEQQTRWPLLDLERMTSIKRRLDIKAPSPASESSSSSDSEAEKTGHMKKQEQKQTNMAGLPIKISQTNVKAPTPDSESSSSSDSEAEKTGHTKKQEQGQTNMARLPIKASQTNVKAPRPDSESSSSSDSEAETTGQIKKQEQGQTNTASLFTKVSHTASNEQQTRWPLLDLERMTSIKRRLDIKAPSPASKSSSSSDSEDETTHHTKKERPELLVIAGVPFTVSQTVSRDPEKQWPAIDLGNTTHIKRRLDIKAPSPTPQALVSSGREWKREGSIKISSSSSSSSSDEQEEGMQGFINPPRTAEPDPHPDSRWPRLGLSSAPHVKRRLDIRARSPPPDSSSSNESEGGTSDIPLKVERDRTTVGITNNPLQTKLPDLNKSIPLVKRRIDIKAPSPQPNPIQSRVSHGSQQSSSSTSDSEDENHTKLGLGASTISKATEKKFNWSPKIPVLHTSRSPQTDHDIKLSKYKVITDGVGDRTSDNINTAPEVTPELQSRWASMNLGISRFRKRLEITSHEPPNLPPSPPPDSPTSRTRRKRWGVGIEAITLTQSSLTPEKASPSLNSVESKERLRKDYRLPKTEEKTTPETKLTSSGNPHLKTYLDIKVSEKAAPPSRQRSHSSSSSDSEDASTEHEGKGWRGRSQLNDTIDHSWPDPSLGVQRTNRNMNIKAASSESSSSSSSSSENEHEGTGYTPKQSRHPSDMLGETKNNSLITYKRQIFSSPTPDHMGAEIVSVAQGGPLLSVGIRDESLAPRRVPSMNFDDVVKKRIEQSRNTTDVDLPPEIRWTGIGRQPSDLSISSTRRQLDINLSTPSAQPPLLDSFNYSSNRSDDGTLRHEYSSLSTNSVHLASSRATEKFDNLPDSLKKMSRAVPEDRRESKGLSALKAMSSERRKWDTQVENLDKGASPSFDDRGPQVDNSFYNRRPEKDIKPPEKRATDMRYDIPRYRRHDIGGTEPPQETPPPIPATPPPDKAAELKWGSPQSSMKQGFAGTRSYLQQNRNRVEPNPSLITSQSLADYFDPTNTNISHV